jgi:acid phosphatase
MQIDGGKNDRFAAFADSGGLVMGHYDGSKLPLWSVAKKYVLADNFFQGAVGGSFLNHFALVCACVPVYPDADKSPAKGLIAAVNPRRRVADARSQFAEIGARRRAEIRQQRPDLAGFLRRQHHAAAVPAEQQQAGAGRRSALCRSERSEHIATATRDHHRRPVEP